MKIASPPSRGMGRRFSRRASGLSTTPSSRAIPPTAGVRRTTISERDRRAVQDLRVVPKLGSLPLYFVPYSLSPASPRPGTM